MTDGLAALEQSRKQRSGRTIPPPKHRARRDAVPATTTTAAAESQPDQDPSPSRPPAEAKQQTPRTNASKRPKAQTVADDKATPATIYLTSTQSDYLQQVYIAGLQRKVDASKSAVARLAIDRLQEQMTPDEIIDTLANKPTPTRTGRPRR